MRASIQSICSATFIAALLAGCGGGGGSSGTPAASSTGSSGAGTGTAAVAAAGTVTFGILGGNGNATSSITASEVAQLQATVRTAAGAPVVGTIVKFSETGTPALLTFSPASATALTDAAGRATVEVRASGTTALGATTVQASASIAPANGAAQTITGGANLAVSSAPAASAADPQALANALNFLDVNPSDNSIVIVGSGGSGRSEAATLRFRVVDNANSPVKGANVVFSAVQSGNPAAGNGDVTLNIAQATSDSDGVVTTSVSSKSVATSVVVRAQVAGRTISSQSDQLTVTTGLATQRGFDLSASKYNLNSAITGDTSTLTVRIVDSNGNPVSNGVPVVFTTTRGAVGTSSRGGCVLAGGQCSVPLLVQNPRTVDGQRALVTASTRLGDGTVISDTLQFAFTDPAWLDTFSVQSSNTVAGTQATPLDLGAACKSTFQLAVGTPAGDAAPAGTTVEVTPLASGVTARVVSGGTILDTRPLGVRTLLVIEVDASGATAPACTPSGNANSPDQFDLQVTFKADNVGKSLIKKIKYPH